MKPQNKLSQISSSIQRPLGPFLFLGVAVEEAEVLTEDAVEGASVLQLPPLWVLPTAISTRAEFGGLWEAQLGKAAIACTLGKAKRGSHLFALIATCF